MSGAGPLEIQERSRCLCFGLDHLINHQDNNGTLTGLISTLAE